jgi:PIN domain nuclease of toxin-antitoxin system
VIYLDTHAAAWLYAGLVERFAPSVRELLAKEELFVSPMVELELQYLHEIGRIGEGGRTVVAGLAALVGLRVCDRPFEQVVAKAVDQTWTRDPFDRLIVAQAAVTDALLVSKDRSIREHYSKAFWDDAL